MSFSVLYVTFSHKESQCMIFFNVWVVNTNPKCNGAGNYAQATIQVTEWLNYMFLYWNQLLR